MGRPAIKICPIHNIRRKKRPQRGGARYCHKCDAERLRMSRPSRSGQKQRGTHAGRNDPKPITPYVEALEKLIEAGVDPHSGAKSVKTLTEKNHAL